MGRWIHLFLVKNHLAVKFCLMLAAIQAVHDDSSLLIPSNDPTGRRSSLFTSVEIFSSNSVMCCVMLTSVEFRSLDGRSTCSGESLLSNSLTLLKKKKKTRLADTFCLVCLKFLFFLKPALKWNCFSFSVWKPLEAATWIVGVKAIGRLWQFRWYL